MGQFEYTLLIQGIMYFSKSVLLFLFAVFISTTARVFRIDSNRNLCTQSRFRRSANGRYAPLSPPSRLFKTRPQPSQTPCDHPQTYTRPVPLVTWPPALHGHPYIIYS